MVALARALTIPRFNKTGMMASFLVLLLTIALFFVPEIMNVSKGSPTKPPSAVEQVDPVVKEVAPIAVSNVPIVQGSEDGLAELSRLIDEGYIDRLRDEKFNALRTAPVASAAVTVPAAGPAESVPLIERVGMKPVKVGDVRSIPVGPIVEGSLSWRELQSAPVKQALKVASRESLLILRGLNPSKMRGSRDALLTYSSALNQLLESGERTIAADEVPHYLGSLEANVVERMRVERVDRADLLHFSQVALANRFSGQATSGINVPKFNPQLTLDSVTVIQPADRWGRFIPSRSAVVELAGFVVGRDVVAIRAMRYGQEVRWTRPLPSPDRFGRRRFHFPRMDARGSYVFEVESASGDVFKKSYDFYSRARTFPWRGDFGAKFMAPIPSGDVRTDRLYTRAGVAQQGEGNLFSSAASSGMTSF